MQNFNSKLTPILRIINLSICPLFFLIVASSSANERFSVVMPADRSIVEWESISVVIKLNKGDFEAITVTKDKTEVFKIPVNGKQYICKTISLSFGLNEITISASDGGKVLESKKVTVFYRSDMSKKFRIAPPEFRRKPFHKVDNEKACVSCHEMMTSEKDIKPQRPVDSICYPCHKKIAEYGYVHGPAATWNCLSCHDRSSSPVKYITRQPEKDLCFVCHKEKKEEWAPKKYWHGPTTTGDCTICHNPHATNNVSWLKKPAWELCVTCHKEKASGRHVVVGFVFGSSHPTKGRPDPLHPRKELSCASCHNPHASNSRSLFANDEISPNSLCQMCHKK